MKCGVPTAHSIDLYEHNLEMFLQRRRAWLWRKTVFMVRLVVKLSKTCHLAHNDDNKDITQQASNSMVDDQLHSVEFTIDVSKDTERSSVPAMGSLVQV